MRRREIRPPGHHDTQSCSCRNTHRRREPPPPGSSFLAARRTPTTSLTLICLARRLRLPRHKIPGVNCARCGACRVRRHDRVRFHSSAWTDHQGGIHHGRGSSDERDTRRCAEISAGWTRGITPGSRAAGWSTVADRLRAQSGFPRSTISLCRLCDNDAVTEKSPLPGPGGARNATEKSGEESMTHLVAVSCSSQFRLFSWSTRVGGSGFLRLSFWWAVSGQPSG